MTADTYVNQFPTERGSNLGRLILSQIREERHFHPEFVVQFVNSKRTVLPAIKALCVYDFFVHTMVLTGEQYLHIVFLEDFCDGAAINKRMINDVSSYSSRLS